MPGTVNHAPTSAIDRRSTQPLEAYALIGNLHTAALVALDGSIDWLCLPRIDSGACFAALLGTPQHGLWRFSPEGPVRRATRRYRGETLVLETEYETDSGTVALIDCMPVHGATPRVVRRVEGRQGHVPIAMVLRPRFDFGLAQPLLKVSDGTAHAVAGSQALCLQSRVPVSEDGDAFVARFTVRAGERLAFVLSWYPSYESAPAEIDAEDAITETERWWLEWSARCTYQGPWREAVVRSLIVEKALTYAPSGGIAAAPTTSLPEHIGGVRNWDYRYCWLRDASFTLNALLNGGYHHEAAAWREWLLRATAGRSGGLRVLYGVGGEYLIHEWEVGWLPGYKGSRPVRIGNGAVDQFQLDAYGEIMNVLYHARRSGIPPHPDVWHFERALIDALESLWTRPDRGIWEVRLGDRHFVHSKVMCWVAADRGIRSAEEFGLDAPLSRWRRLRETIARDIADRGFHQRRGTFVQHYDSRAVDASLLRLPLVGFLPADDPRMIGTVAAIERDLLEGGLVHRYRDYRDVDGLPGREGPFLPCAGWLVEVYWMQGRRDDAVALFERLLSIRNDVGLLSEEYDVPDRRLVGNFPQGFSHVALINAAFRLSGHGQFETSGEGAATERHQPTPGHEPAGTSRP